MDWVVVTERCVSQMERFGMSPAGAKRTRFRRVGEEFSLPRQKATVEPGERKRVFYQTIPAGAVGFISKAGYDHVAQDRVEWIIDGRAYPNDFYHQFAPKDKPEHFDPPYIVQYAVEWWYTNRPDGKAPDEWKALDIEVYCPITIYTKVE